MLNPFPELLFYSQMGPFILRVVLGIILLELGILKFRSEKERWIRTFEALSLKPAHIFVFGYGVLEIAGAILLIVGLWTQIAALAFAILSGIELYIEWKEDRILRRDIVFYVLMFSISLSLLVTGAGSYAFDIPL